MAILKHNAAAVKSMVIYSVVIRLKYVLILSAVIYSIKSASIWEMSQKATLQQISALVAGAGPKHRPNCFIQISIIH